jgi:hypothetical protein
MAKSTKSVDVHKFGGVDQLGSAQMEHKYDISNIETQSKTNLESDKGFGNAAIIRCFEFGINREVFKLHQPTKQELFNAHHKGIELALWRDGLKVIPGVDPRIVIDEDTMTYKILVGAQPMKGHMLTERPRTLSELAHG